MQLSLMPRMSLDSAIRLAQALRVCGGLTSSIFPRVEALILNDTDYQQALEFVASRKDMSRYQSIMDFLFCEIFPVYRAACFRYYLGNGEMLKDQITVTQMLYFENVLLVAMEVAHKAFEEKRCSSWKAFRGQVLEAIKTAA